MLPGGSGQLAGWAECACDGTAGEARGAGAGVDVTTGPGGAVGAGESLDAAGFVARRLVDVVAVLTVFVVGVVLVLVFDDDRLVPEVGTAADDVGGAANPVEVRTVVVERTASAGVCVAGVGTAGAGTGAGETIGAASAAAGETRGGADVAATGRAGAGRRWMAGVSGARGGEDVSSRQGVAPGSAIMRLQNTNEPR